MYGLRLGEMRTRFIMNEQFGNQECCASAGAGAQRLFGVRMDGGMNLVQWIVSAPVRRSKRALVVINEQLNLRWMKSFGDAKQRIGARRTWFWAFALARTSPYETGCVRRNRREGTERGNAGGQSNGSLGIAPPSSQ
jgi:hypothetical protein